MGLRVKFENLGNFPTFFNLHSGVNHCACSAPGIHCLPPQCSQSPVRVERLPS
jgi:hypothetical protein